MELKARGALSTLCGSVPLDKSPLHLFLWNVKLTLNLVPEDLGAALGWGQAASKPRGGGRSMGTLGWTPSASLSEYLLLCTSNPAKARLSLRCPRCLRHRFWASCCVLTRMYLSGSKM